MLNVASIIRDLARVHRLGKVYAGPITVRLADDTVVEPDVLFVRAERLSVVDPRKGVFGVPDLVVEVLSQSNRGYDQSLKRRRYQRSGVLETWILDPQELGLEVWRPDSLEPERPIETVTWRVGEHAFEIPLAEIFRG